MISDDTPLLKNETNLQAETGNFALAESPGSLESFQTNDATPSSLALLRPATQRQVRVKIVPSLQRPTATAPSRPAPRGGGRRGGGAVGGASTTKMRSTSISSAHSARATRTTALTQSGSFLQSGGTSSLTLKSKNAEAKGGEGGPTNLRVAASRSLRPHSRESKKRKAHRLLQSISALEDKERTDIKKEAIAEWNRMLQHIALNSFHAHRRALLYMQDVFQKALDESDGRARRAEEALALLTRGMVQLVKTVHKTGVGFLKDTDFLSGEIFFDKADIKVDATVLECARDPSWRLQEAHPPLKKPDLREIQEIESINSFFLNLNVVDDEKSTLPLENIEVVVREVDEVHSKVGALESALLNLFQRAQRTIEQYKRKNDLLQRSIDEKVTRVKVADDILHETIMKQKEEAGSAIQLCGQFGMELRTRMDAIEKYVKDTLGEVIERSTEVAIENNAYHEHAQLIHNKENVFQFCMSKMDSLVVEQGKLLSDVRLAILKLWKTRCGYGDEERATLMHSGLPKNYRVALDACDRDTLLRFLHFVSLNSADAPALLIGALDEHEHFTRSNTAEAQAVAQRAATETAVAALLEKLYEEKEIKLNPCLRGDSIVDIINDMVLRYNVYMGTQEKKQRRALRKKEKEEAALFSYPFFDSRTPVPQEYAADITTSLHDQTKQSLFNNNNTGAKNQAESATQKSNSFLPFMGNTQNSGAGATGMAPPQVGASYILNNLRRSHPSALDPPGTASVVGFGRWGGKLPQQSVSTDGKKHFDVSGQHVVNASNNVNGSFLTTNPNPPPGVPPRLTIVRHMLEDHSNDLGTLSLQSNMNHNCFHGEDESFLKLQRKCLETMM